MRAIDADAISYESIDSCDTGRHEHYYGTGIIAVRKEDIDAMPTIQPEPHEIGYDDCANALLKMWMDNVLTDGEYYRIADKLNKKWGKVEVPEPYKGGGNVDGDE